MDSYRSNDILHLIVYIHTAKVANVFIQYPEESIIKEKYEPMVLGTIICPSEYISTVTNLAMVCN